MWAFDKPAIVLQRGADWANQRASSQRNELGISGVNILTEMIPMI